MKWLKILVFFIIFLIFIYLRVTPIINQTVPYTYDQGRDFLKVEEMIRDKNLVFIGPTTGIMGVFHGAWWYYLLSVFYLIFNGWPSGFYIGLFIISTLSILIFTYFIYKRFGFLSSLIFFTVSSSSIFAIRLAFFASNNIIAPLFILLYIYSLYEYLLSKKIFFLFLIGLALGFIFEFEVAFGIFFITSFVISTVVEGSFRKIYKNFKNIFYLSVGVFIPIIPRLLFEIKNNLIQTKAFANFVRDPTSTNPVTYLGAFIDRSKMFINYFFELFVGNSTFLAILTLFMVIIFFLNKKIETYKKNRGVISFLTIQLIGMFFLSTLNKNNFFWSYYLDGIQFIFIFLVLLIINLNNDKKYLVFKNILVVSIIIFTLFSFRTELSKKPIPSLGLRADIDTVKYLINSNKEQFCLRVYTPPIFPYTYQYLFSYFSKIKRRQYPSGDFINNQCWFIIDHEPYAFRLEKWRKENTPKDSKLIKIKKMENKTNIELWQIPQN
ncbi:MAG: hypothetical protein UR89_C0009G0024 [Candidatus Roizmanbacteria bacterium GW2011_GWA2_35_8]|uniref:Glycosyltransferase RgtA/B/C/D-like domain-containing protein n=1 Tax=Candidatus Roizmanbacteria bacterium GW2011_GWA2_35_8 TaxID=1618479 RepID=A0A0G0D0Z3_9BACT|nr:MAG: hypothetical protein UR89_C0009G0024 [Candidatus Roizmanbacteria bacterium GW2011_GWA2_35_8]